MVNLATTNLLLGIMAAVSVLQAIVLVAAGIGGYIAYRRVMQIVQSLEQRQVAPAMARVNDILDDVKGVTGLVTEEAGRVDQAIRETAKRVDETADRVRVTMRTRTRRAMAIARGIRRGVAVFVNGDAGRTARTPA